MKKILLRAVTLCLCGVLILSGLMGSVQATDEIRAAKKIISVVCDDSGSMAANNKWSYANYATQALISQLNQQDELYITFMSKPNKAQSIDTGKLAKEVENMGKRDCPGDTPYDAIETAYEKLKGTSASDSNAQYWLIVTTDGDVRDVPTSNGMNGTVQSVLDSYKGQKMPNGTNLNVVYLAMDGAYACTGDAGNSLYTYTATSPEEISKSLSSISNLISSRMEATPLTQVDATTVSFKTDLPMYSFSVLSQQSSATVTAVSGNLNVDRNISLKKDHLFGNAAVVNASGGQGQQVIPAGTYTVTFSEPVDTEDLLIQYEPAIGVKMEIRCQGVEVTDPANLVVDETMSIELIPVIPGTDTPIDPATLPAGIRWKVEYHVDGSLKDSTPTSKLSSTVICKGENLIRGTMQIPGFSELIFEKKFTVTNVIYGLTVSQQEDIHYPRENAASLVDKNPIIFTVTDDGVPMTKGEIEANKVALKVADIQVENDHITPNILKGSKPANIAFRLNSDGTFTLVPETSAWNVLRTKSGKYTVTVTINNATHLTATGEFELDPSMRDLIGGILIWLIPVYGIWWLLAHLIKKKFKQQTVEIVQYIPSVGNSGSQGTYKTQKLHLLSGLNLLNLLIPNPFKPYRVKLKSCGVVVEAGGDGSVFVTGSSIEKNRNIVAYGASTVDPIRDLAKIRNSLRKVSPRNDRNAVRTASDKELQRNTVLFLECNGGAVYGLRLLR